MFGLAMAFVFGAVWLLGCMACVALLGGSRNPNWHWELGLALGAICFGSTGVGYWILTSIFP